MRHSDNWTKGTIATIWATLEAGGLRPPDSWQRPEVREAAYEVWRVGLGSLPPSQARAAAVAYSSAPDRSEGYSGPAGWPAPDQIVHRAFRMLAEIDGTRSMSASEAWGLLRSYITRWGTNQPPTRGKDAEVEAPRGVTTHEIIKRVWAKDGTFSMVRTTREVSCSTPWWRLHDEAKQREILERTLEAVGGWRDFCLSTDDQVMSLRARFIEAYDSYQRRFREERTDRSIIAEIERRGGPLLGVMPRMIGEDTP